MDKKIIERERRKDLRIDIFKPLIVRSQIKKQKGIFKFQPKKVTTAENISVGGLALEFPALDQKQIDRIIKGKDKLVLELDIPSLKKPLRVTGNIVWLKKRDRRGRSVYVAGISFTDIKEKDREKLLSGLIDFCLKSNTQI